MDVKQHDRLAASVSHVPHVAAAAMVNLLNRYPGDEQSLLNLAGGGFCDTTRIASSNADMWADICLTNAAAVNHGLRDLIDIFTEVIAAIDRGDRDALHEYFRSAKTRRDKIVTNSSNGESCC
jgi:prephenate dehydrogenase